jgi:hypothetical protein
MGRVQTERSQPMPISDQIAFSLFTLTIASFSPEKMPPSMRYYVIYHKPSFLRINGQFMIIWVSGSLRILTTRASL